MPAIAQLDELRLRRIAVLHVHAAERNAVPENTALPRGPSFRLPSPAPYDKDVLVQRSRSSRARSTFSDGGRRIGGGQCRHQDGFGILAQIVFHLLEQMLISSKAVP